MAELISTGCTGTLISPFDIRRFTEPTGLVMPQASLPGTGRLV
jgi:sarcosine oxidase subunit beta